MKIKAKNKVWNALPFIGKDVAQAIYPYIYLPRDVYENVFSSQPNPRYLALFAHELVHVRRQEMGVGRWYLLYICNPRFRYQEELVAIKVQYRYLRSKQLGLPIERMARSLSSWLYGWMVTNEQASKDLIELAE